MKKLIALLLCTTAFAFEGEHLQIDLPTEWEYKAEIDEELWKSDMWFRGGTNVIGLTSQHLNKETSLDDILDQFTVTLEQNGMKGHTEILDRQDDEMILKLVVKVEEQEIDSIIRILMRPGVYHTVTVVTKDTTEAITLAKLASLPAT